MGYGQTATGKFHKKCVRVKFGQIASAMPTYQELAISLRAGALDSSPSVHPLSWNQGLAVAPLVNLVDQGNSTPNGLCSVIEDDELELVSHFQLEKV